MHGSIDGKTCEWLKWNWTTRTDGCLVYTDHYGRQWAVGSTGAEYRLTRDGVLHSDTAPTFTNDPTSPPRNAVSRRWVVQCEHIIAQDCNLTRCEYLGGCVFRPMYSDAGYGYLGSFCRECGSELV